jgi:hypothetical protein
MHQDAARIPAAGNLQRGKLRGASHRDLASYIGLIDYHETRRV